MFLAAQAQVASYLGRYIDYDGYYGDQCMDEVLQFQHDIGGPLFWGNAADTYGQYPNWYVPLGNVPPNPGDIAVFQRSQANGNAGHISLVHHNDGPSFVSVDQNWGTPYCMYVRHDFSQIIGFMRPVIYWNQGGNLPYSDDQYNALKADRDRYAEDWARLRYLLGPAHIEPTRDERRLRLGLTWEQALADLDKNLPITLNFGSKVTRQQVIDYMNSKLG